MGILDLNSKGLKRRLDKVEYIFNRDNVNFDKNNDYNLFFFQRTQSYLNDKLNQQGYVFLNEVLDLLGLERRMIGQLAGWRVDASGFIEIKVTQTKYRGFDVDEYFIRIEHDGLIFDILGD